MTSCTAGQVTTLCIDVLSGEESNDKLYGGGGNDHLSGGTGDDQLCGEADDDRMFGGDGQDAMFGGGGSWNGASGADYMDSEAGNDKLYGGKHLATLDFDVANIRSATTLEPIRALRGNGSGFALAYTERGDYLAVRDSVGIHVWEVATGRLAAKLADPNQFAGPLAISPDGQSLAAGNFAGYILVWYWKTDRPPRRLTSHVGWVTGLAYSSDGKRLASYSRDGSVKVWNPDAGEELLGLTRTNAGEFNCVVFSPCGKRLFARASGGVRIWEVASAAHRPPPPGLAGRVSRDTMIALGRATIRRLVKEHGLDSFRASCDVVWLHILVVRRGTAVTCRVDKSARDRTGKVTSIANFSLPALHLGGYYYSCPLEPPAIETRP